MALTLQQLQEKHQGVQPRKVVSLETIKMQAETKNQTQGNQFEQEQPTGILGFGKKAFDTVFGGVKLAEGLGKAIAAPGVQKQMSEAEQKASDTEFALVKAINQNKQSGKDTSRLEKALQRHQESMKVIRDAQEDFTSSLPTNKEVIGSTARLGAAALAPTIGSGMATATGAKTAVGIGQGALRGGLAGAGTGLTTGALVGAGAGLEQNLDASGVAKSAAVGGATGLVTGGILGAGTGAFVGRANAKVDPNTLLAKITPDPKQLTPTEYKKALAQGKITPKSGTSPASYKLDETQKAVALKYADVVDNDPVKTVNNINETLSSLDDEVGGFLKQNNGIFSRGELRNRLTDSLDDITDITVDQKTIEKTKNQLINNFIDDIDKNDMVSAWEARKAFDQKIDAAFRGAPSLQKELKVAFRNAVQDFISEKTPDTTYSGYMKDMSNLFRLRDNVALKAVKERGDSGIQAWIKANPLKAQAITAGLTGAGAVLATKAFGGGQAAD